MVRRRVVRMHLMVSMHGVVVVPSDHGCGTHPLTVRTQHGRRHRSPDGEQDGEHDQDEDAEVFHVRQLSGNRADGSVRAAQWTIRIVWLLISGPNEPRESREPAASTRHRGSSRRPLTLFLGDVLRHEESRLSHYGKVKGRPRLLPIVW